MNKYLLGILIVAASLRIISLDTHMPALYGDEISIAYNAYSVLTTGKDEFGKFLPIQFESWGDQKNPVYIYLVALVQIIVGLNEWSVRIPSALAGIGAVYITYLLTKLLLEEVNLEEKIKNQISLVAASLLAISPWHIHISRGGYEANLALTLGIIGTYYFLKFTKGSSKTYAAISLMCFSLAMYTYYTTKMFIPMLLLLLMVYSMQWSKDTWSHVQKCIKFFIGLCIVCIPIIYLALFSNGQARFQSINIFSQVSIEGRVITARQKYTQHPFLGKMLENKFTYYTRDFLEYYFENFSGQFWYVAGDSSLRYTIGNHGMFYLIESIFFLGGIVMLFRINKKLGYFLVIWLLLAPLPTALVGRSYGLRSLAMLPIPMLFTAVGLTLFVNSLQKNTYKKLAIVGLAGIFTVSFANWILRYIYFYPVYGMYWYDGMQKEMIEYAKKEEKNFDHIILSRWYGKTEMYYAFYGKVNPEEYQKKSQEKTRIADTEMVQFGKYYFGDINPNGKEIDELNIPPNTLIIGSPQFAFSDSYMSAGDDQRMLFKVVKYK